MKIERPGMLGPALARVVASDGIEALKKPRMALLDPLPRLFMGEDEKLRTCDRIENAFADIVGS